MNKFSLHQLVAMIIFAIFTLGAHAQPEMMGIGNDLLGLPVESNNSKADKPKDKINSEVIVFVDVSGSMKQNDPLNMRSPAIRLLSGMAPENAKVGIYLFGTSVRELVPFDSVSEEWKRMAEQHSNRYQSRDLYTNIESALVSAETKWTQDTNRQRSIILLTDGIVDIDKNSLVSMASRDRILDSVITSLQEQKVNVHTIALSKNADHRLLKELAVATEGHYQQVDNADLLQRTFMSLFEQSAPQDTVPLEGNKVNVDNSISELTLLVFRKSDSKPTQLISPQGVVYDKSSSFEYLKWKNDTGYDLISIKQPEAGVWQLIADEDPDNRAMIVTDLKLQTSDLPSVVLNGEEASLEVWMEEKGEKITRSDFLKLIKSNLVTTYASGEQHIKPLDSPSAEGLITYQHGTEWQVGEQELVLKIESETFIREKRFPITAHASPIEVSWQEIVEEKGAKKDAKKMLSAISGSVKENETENQEEIFPTWEFLIKIIPELIYLEQSNLTVEITNQKNIQQTIDLIDIESGWLFQYTPDQAGQSIVNLRLKTISPSGREVVINHPEIKLGEFIEMAETEAPIQQEVIVEESASPNMMQIVIPVAIGNVVYLILFLAWRWFKKVREAAYVYPEEIL